VKLNWSSVLAEAFAGGLGTALGTVLFVPLGLWLYTKLTGLTPPLVA
jgi:hypothetical protein